NEETILRFKNLYKCFGYKQYKMSKFEEYDLYAENKNFLQNSNIITFTDLNGKLMALKPDVTLSIAKNVKDTAGTQKVYYSENVYRARKDGNEFKEIMQTGLECMDDIDLYSMGEVLMLAAKSLELISENYILDISHTGFVTELFKEIPENKREVLLSYVNAKNSIGIKKACAEFGLGVSLTEKAVKLASLYGPFDEVIMELKKLSINNNTDSVIDELEGIYNMLKVCGCEKNINIDFSIINDMSYYNGIVFKGYVAGIPSNILSGGRYDKLLQKLGKNAGAIGFALYLDMLDWLNADDEEYDADVLVINDGSQAADDVAKTVMEIVAEGETVSVLSKLPPNGRYKRIVRIDERGLENVETVD
ncbi:MAG: ATP phosphoribosyltransferase regulatory subunit, partial [Clostridiales bacterium]|nr:ATP phosphoribosyltransferase regulatory subunit [Clostridiales bacterium]